METYKSEGFGGDLYLSVTRLVSGIQLQLYWSYPAIPWQQLVTLDDVTGHSKPCA